MIHILLLLVAKALDRQQLLVGVGPRHLPDQRVQTPVRGEEGLGELRPGRDYLAQLAELGWATVIFPLWQRLYSVLTLLLTRRMTPPMIIMMVMAPRTASDTDGRGVIVADYVDTPNSQGQQEKEIGENLPCHCIAAFLY